MCSFFPCFCLCFCCWRSHWTQLYRFCLRICRWYKLIFDLHRFPTKRLLHSMLLQIYWTNCFSLHIASNNLSAKKRRKFTARNASLCPSLNVWENHKYFNNKLQVSMRTWKNKKDLATLLRELSPTQILIGLLISNILRYFDWLFRRPYRYFLFVLTSDFILVWSLWSFHNWLMLDWIAVKFF